MSPAGGLDLDHLGPEIEQVFGAMRASEYAGEVDDAHALWWQAHDHFPSNRAAPGPKAANDSRPCLRSADLQ
jgi:hypothetical protein